MNWGQKCLMLQIYVFFSGRPQGFDSIMNSFYIKLCHIKLNNKFFNANFAPVFSETNN